MNNIVIGPYIIPVEVRVRRFARSVRMSVTAQGIRVSAGARTQKSQILAFIQEKADWILSAYNQVLSAVTLSVWHEGQTFAFFGKNIPLKILHKEGLSQARLLYIRDTFFVALPPQNTIIHHQNILRTQMQKWYKTQSHRVFESFVHEYTAKLGVRHASISIKDMRTQWGSCTADQKLCFNWKLALAPVEVAKYVVAHEVSHILHKHHQRTFWQCVGELNLEYRMHRRWLKTHGTKLQI